MKVGETKNEHNDFIMQLTQNDPSGMWDYEIGGRDIIDPLFSVYRESRNKYYSNMR